MFRRDTPDQEWLATLAEEGDWVIVSGDPRITRGKHERQAWLESGLTAFFLGKGLGGKELLEANLRACQVVAADCP